MRDLDPQTLVDSGTTGKLFSLAANLMETREKGYTIMKIPKYITFYLEFNKPRSTKSVDENDKVKFLSTEKGWCEVFKNVSDEEFELLETHLPLLIPKTLNLSTIFRISNDSIEIDHEKRIWRSSENRRKK